MSAIQKLIDYGYIDKTPSGRELKAAEQEIAAMREDLKAAYKRIAEMSNNDSWAVDEFNAGYQAYEAGLDLDSAEALHRHALPAEVPSFDEFGCGYAWAKFQKERQVSK